MSADTPSGHAPVGASTTPHPELKTTRRQFVGAGLAASALSVAATRSLAGGTADIAGLPGAGSPGAPGVLSGSLPISELIYDQGFAAGRLFAAHASVGAVPLHAINGDVTALWYHDLYHRWRAGPGIIAGLTDASALFCLEQLSRGCDRRVLLRIDHAPRADGRIAHRYRGPAELLPLAQRASARADWAEQMAHLVLRFPAAAAPPVQGDLWLSPAEASTQPSEPLVTWLIAPRLPAAPAATPA